MYLHYAVFLPVGWHPQRRERMRHLALAAVLACVLSGAVTAGEIPSGDRTTPQATSSVVPPGEIPTSDRTTPSSAGEVPTTGSTAPDSSIILLTIVRSEE